MTISERSPILSLWCCIVGSNSGSPLRGVPVWISNPNVATAKINLVTLHIPTATAQGDLERNVIRGFGATKVDFTLRRQFRLQECLSLG